MEPRSGFVKPSLYPRSRLHFCSHVCAAQCDVNGRAHTIIARAQFQHTPKCSDLGPGRRWRRGPTCCECRGCQPPSAAPPEVPPADTPTLALSPSLQPCQLLSKVAVHMQHFRHAHERCVRFMSLKRAKNRSDLCAMLPLLYRIICAADDGAR